MIRKEGLRHRSYYLESEYDQSIKEELETLDESEREFLANMFDPSFAEEMVSIEYKQVPVDMYTFLTDKYYLGNVGKTLYPALMDDLIELFSGEYHEAILGGSIGCLAGESFVSLANGDIRRIDSLCECVGDVNQIDGSMPFAGVSTGIKPTVLVKFGHGLWTRCTPDHKWMTQYGWVEAKDLIASDHRVKTPRIIHTVPDVFDVSLDEAEWIGMLTADGQLREKNGNNFNKADPDVVDRFKVLTESLGLTWSMHKTDVNCLKVYVDSRSYEIIDKHGLRGTGSYSKFVSDKILRSSNDIVARYLKGIFLDAMWSIDSHSKSGKKATFKVTLGLANEILIKSVWHMLKRFGIRGKVYTKEDVRENEQVMWFVQISGKSNLIRFAECIGCGVVHHQDKFNKMIEALRLVKENSNVDLLPLTISQASDWVKSHKVIRKAGSRYGAWCHSTAGARQLVSHKMMSEFLDEHPHMRSYQDEIHYSENVLWESVKEVVHDNKHVATSDLVVPNVNSYIADGVLSHNCGKTTVGHIAIIRMLYEASCLNNPQASYGIMDGTPICFANVGVNKTNAEKVVFEGVLSKLQLSEYFKKDFKPINASKKELMFLDNIQVLPGSSSETGVIGMNIFGAIMDETNFMDRGRRSVPQAASHARWGQPGNAQTLYTAIHRRMKSRFMRQGKLPGILMLLSSKQTVNDFTNKRIMEAMNDPHIFVRDHSQWGVKDRKFFSPKTFKVLIGNDKIRSKILSPDEVVNYDDAESGNGENGPHVIDIPDDFRADFEGDLENAIRDIAGIATMAISNFLQKREKIFEMINRSRSHPFSVMSYDMSKPGGFLWEKICTKIYDQFDKNLFEWVPLLNPHSVRYAHIDPSLNNDATGICFKEHTKVLMLDLSEKNIEDVVVGDYVIDAYGNPQVVTRTFKRSFKGKLKVIKVQGGITIHCTDEHPILATKSEWVRRKDGDRTVPVKPSEKRRSYHAHRRYDPEFIDAKELKVGDYVALPKVNFSAVPKWMSNLGIQNSIMDINNEDFAVVSGYYLAEGSLFRHSGECSKLFPQFSFGWNGLDERHYSDCEKRLRSLLKDSCILALKRRVCGKQSGYCVRVLSRYLGAMLKLFYGEYCQHKFISPSLLWMVDDLFRDALVTAYFKGDGNVNAIRRGNRGGRKVGISWTMVGKTASERLALQLELLCRGKGLVVSKLADDWEYTKNQERRSIVYRVQINGRDQIEHLVGQDTVDSINVEKSKKSSVKGYSHKSWVMHPITAISEEDHDGDVFNLETSGSHTYIAERVGVHNCVGHISHTTEVIRRRKDSDGSDIMYKETAPFIVIDFILQIVPPIGEEIVLGDVRQLIYDMSAHGFPIRLVTLDSYQCFTGDTCVDLLDGRSLSMKELVDEFGVDKEFYVYSFDGDKIVPGKAKNARKTGHKEIVSVRIDNGSVVRCTKNHLWMMRDGSWKMAKDLVSGESLMPLYKRRSSVHSHAAMEDYEEIYQPVSNSWELTHRVVGEYVWQEIEGKLIHHEGKCVCGCCGRIKHCRSNNDPASLMLVEYKDHIGMHGALSGEATKARLDRERNLPDNEIEILRKKRAEVLRKTNLRPDVREKLDDIGRKRLKEINDRRWTEESREEQRDIMASMNREKSGSNHYKWYDLDVEYVTDLIEKVGISKAAKVLGKNRNVLREKLKAYGVDVRKRLNHKVVSVEDCGLDDVFDIEVEDHHMFALSCGVFVHNSADGIQQFKNKGYRSKVLSMDVSPEPYDNAKLALYENRVDCYPYELLTDELKCLEKDAATGKVDHRATSTKDLSDSFAGVIHTLTTMMQYPVPPMERGISERPVKDDQDEDWLLHGRHAKVDKSGNDVPMPLPFLRG